MSVESNIISIGTISSKATTLTSMVDSVTKGSSVEDIALASTNKTRFLATTALDCLSLIHSFSCRVMDQVLSDRSEIYQCEGGETYKRLDSEEYDGPLVKRSECSSVTYVDGPYRRLAIVRLSDRKLHIVDDYKVVKEESPNNYINLFWALFSFMKRAHNLNDIYLWDLDTTSFNRINRYETQIQVNNRNFTRENKDFDGNVDILFEVNKVEVVKVIGTQKDKVESYSECVVRLEPREYKSVEEFLYIKSQPTDISFSCTADYDEESPRGSQTPYRFYSNHSGVQLSFSCELNQQDYDESLTEYVKRATFLTRPIKRSDYSVTPKIVDVTIGEERWSGYCSDVRVNYSGDSYFGNKSFIRNGVPNKTGFYGVVTLDFTILLIEDINLNKLSNAESVETPSAPEGEPVDFSNDREVIVDYEIKPV